MEIAHESVFVSAIRSLCKTFFSLIGIFLALFVAFFLYSIFSSPYEPELKTEFAILPDLNSDLAVRPFNSPVILRININGVIGEPLLDTKAVENILIDSRRGILQNNRVKAILLHLNTPGGTVTDSDNIYRMLKTYKETYKTPIFAYVDGLCASGGMYVSSAADRIYASPPSIVGSVGVIFGPFFNVYEALNKIGVQSKTLTEGLDKDAMNPLRPWKPDEEASFQAIMAANYHRFVEIVTAAHPRLDPDKLTHEYGAKVFDGAKAQELGYIEIANAEYKTALKDLMAEANIDPSHPYQVVELAPRRDLSHLFMGSKSPLFTGKIEHELNWGDKRSSSTRDQFAYLYTPGVSL